MKRMLRHCRDEEGKDDGWEEEMARPMDAMARERGDPTGGEHGQGRGVG
ncbi:hypothetical protein [Thermaurantiacus tibetensis]|nr:hypothetical protein [Thermaurantiacus tibetensis]